MEEIVLGGGATSRSLTVTAEALAVVIKSGNLGGATVTGGSLQVIDKTAATAATSISSGTVKASAGILYGWICTTSGDLEPKAGNTSLGRVAVTAGQVTNFHTGINCATSISFSASAAVATVFYI